MALPEQELEKVLAKAESVAQPAHAHHGDVPDAANKRIRKLGDRNGLTTGDGNTHRIFCQAVLIVAAAIDDEAQHDDAIHHLTQDTCARRGGKKSYEMCALCRLNSNMGGRFEEAAELGGGEALTNSSFFALPSSRPAMLVADKTGLQAMVTGAKRALEGAQDGASLLSRERRRNVRRKQPTECECAQAVLVLRAKELQECPTCLRALPNITDKDFAAHIDACQPAATRPEISFTARAHASGRH